MTHAPAQPASAPRWWTIADICREMQVTEDVFHRSVKPQIVKYRSEINRRTVRYLRQGVVDWMEGRT